MPQTTVETQLGYERFVCSLTVNEKESEEVAYFLSQYNHTYLANETSTPKQAVDDQFGYERFLCSLFNEQVIAFTVSALHSSHQEANDLKLYSAGSAETCYVEFVGRACSDDRSPLFFTDIVAVHRLDLAALVRDKIIGPNTARKLNESARNLQQLRADLGETSRRVPALSELDRAECERRVWHGHGFHPLHKLRFGIEASDMSKWVPEYRPLVRVALAKLPAHKCTVHGPFKAQLEQLVLASSESSKKIGILAFFNYLFRPNSH